MLGSLCIRRTLWLSGNRLGVETSRPRSKIVAESPEDVERGIGMAMSNACMRFLRKRGLVMKLWGTSRKRNVVERKKKV